MLPSEYYITRVMISRARTYVVFIMQFIVIIWNNWHILLCQDSCHSAVVSIMSCPRRRTNPKEIENWRKSETKPERLAPREVQARSNVCHSSCQQKYGYQKYQRYDTESHSHKQQIWR